MADRTVPRFDADASAAEVTAALHEHGVAIVERLADADLCDRVASELAPHLERTPTGGDVAIEENDVHHQ